MSGWVGGWVGRTFNHAELGEVRVISLVSFKVIRITQAQLTHEVAVGGWVGGWVGEMESGD